MPLRLDYDRPARHFLLPVERYSNAHSDDRVCACISVFDFRMIISQVIIYPFNNPDVSRWQLAVLLLKSTAVVCFDGK
jgi:hypothetical protein